MELPQQRRSLVTEDISKKLKNCDGLIQEKILFTNLGKNLLSLIFDYLSRYDYFTSVALVNKYFNSVCKFYQNHLSHFNMGWDFDHSHLFIIDPILLNYICESYQIKKIKLKKKSMITKTNISKIPSSTLFKTFMRCRWTRTIVNLEIDIFKITPEMNYFFNELTALKSLKIDVIRAKQSQIVYLLKKFIDSHDRYNADTQLEKFGKVFYHPLEKFYFKSYHTLNHWNYESFNLFEIFLDNKNLIVFEFFSLDLNRFFIQEKIIEIKQKPSLEKLSIEKIGNESLTEFISICNLKHLHLDLNFKKNCSLIALLIKNHPTLKCLKIFKNKEMGYKESYFSNFSIFFNIISESKLQKIEIFYLNRKEFQNCFLEFLQILKYIQKVKINISSMENLSDDFIFDCFSIPKVQSLNKIKKEVVFPNKFGIVKIKPINFSNYNDAIYSILLSESALKVENLKQIEYQERSVNIDQLAQFFFKVHRIHSDALEDLYILNKVKNNNCLEEIYLIVSENLLFNNLVFFKILSKYSDCFVSVKVLHILIKSKTVQLFHYTAFNQKFLSLPNLEEFYLELNKDYECMLMSEFCLTPSSLHKISIKNHGIPFDLGSLSIQAITNVLYLEISNFFLDCLFLRYLIENIDKNKVISTLILENITCDRINSIDEFVRLMTALQEKENIEKLEITVNKISCPTEFSLHKAQLKRVTRHYLGFLKKFFKNNSNLKSFNFYIIDLPAQCSKKFYKLIFQLCNNNQNLNYLFGIPVNKIICVKTFYEGESKICNCVICLNLDFIHEKNFTQQTISIISIVNIRELSNEFKHSKLKYNFTSIDYLSICPCKEIRLGDFDFENDQVKLIIEKIKPLKISISQANFEKLQNNTNYVDIIRKNTELKII